MHRLGPLHHHDPSLPLHCGIVVVVVTFATRASLVVVDKPICTYILVSKKNK